MIHVYGIFHTDNNELVYVGRTENPTARFSSHRSSVRFKGPYAMEIFESTDGNGRELEYFWIHYARFMGCNLFNKYIKGPVDYKMAEKPLNKFKEIRESKYMTQAELADRSGVAIGVISKAENGGKISLGSIKNIAKGLGVNPDKLR